MGNIKKREEIMNFPEPRIIMFFIYITAMLMIGFAAYRSTKNLSDYILGGRSLGSVVTALSAGASDMSGWLLMGLPGAIFISGLSESWIAIGLLLGAWLNWYIIAGRLRVFTEYNKNALTLPDYFAARFDDNTKLLKIFAALIILFFFIIYCASGVVAGARLFESMFEMKYSTAIWIGAIATMLYVFIGGFLAVSWTDTIQATLMIIALLITPMAVILSLGDISNAVERIVAISPSYVDPFYNISIISLFSLLAWGLGYFGQPHILVRFMAASSVKNIPNARRISMIWMFLCLAGAVSVGFFGIAYFSAHSEQASNVIQNPESIFLELAKFLLNPWIAGLVLSGVLAAVMSTLSCQLLVASSALTEDIYKAFFRKSAGDKEQVWVGRIMVFIIALIAIYIAQDPHSKVLGLVAYAWAGFGAAFGPIVIFSVMWKRMTRNGALAGMIVGAMTVILYKNSASIATFLFYPNLSAETLIAHYPILGLYEIIPGFIFASLAIIVVSLLGKRSSELETRFDKAAKSYHQQMAE